MKRLKKWRYYCDYCKKSGGSGGHIKRHEESCTMNPNRVCGMCKHTDEEQPKMADMILILDAAIINNGQDDRGFEFWTIKNEKEALGALRRAANNCPACILAALRQYKYPFLFGSFSFEAEKKSFWSDVNESNRDCYDYY